MNPVQKAQDAVNAILAQLETETGQVVESIALQSVDMTNLDSPRQQLLRSAVIAMVPIPGTSWALDPPKTA